MRRRRKEHGTTAPAPRDLSAADRWPECPLCARRPSVWELEVVDPDAASEGTWEALMTLGNGYVATRGAIPECEADPVHYPGTYVAGVYNRLVSSVDGIVREDESMVNLPNWLPVIVRSPRGDVLGGAGSVIEHDHRLLDMRHGLLLREARVTDASGNRSLVSQQRLVSMSRPHLASLRTMLTPVDWSGPVHIEAWTDGAVRNDNVASARALAATHLAVRESRTESDGCAVLVVETTQSHLRIAVATRTFVDGTPLADELHRERGVGVQGDAVVTEGARLVIDKDAAVFTARDHAISEPSVAAREELLHAPRFARARHEHALDWRHAWRRMRLEVGTADAASDPDIQRALNLHLFHVTQVLSRHAGDADVGIPARGLHGEAYRGLVFWDELFVFPLLNLRVPELTRSLLMYRYRRLSQARRLAASIGADGALFPWQSGSDGREETPESFFNPRSGDWMADSSQLQFHVGLAVAYNVWHYFQVTDDIGFLSSYGAELLVEIARFWAAQAEYDAGTGRYHLRGTMGPDEFHDGYPGRPGHGIDDNAYVAVLTSWLFVTTLRAYDVLGGHHTEDLWQRLGLDEDELRQWDALSRRLHVPFLPGGLMAQFEGYADLDEFDFGTYRSRYGDIGRLDLILAAEGDSTNRYKVSKQADVLMLFYLFSADELAAVMTRLGYDFDPQSIPATIDYYLARTTHGSTLSRVVHSWVLARGDRLASWHLLREALDADRNDTQGGTTREGIHLGAMAATADILQRCFTGLEIRDDALHLHPQLPDAIDRLSCELRYRGHALTLVVTHRMMRLASHPGDARPIEVIVDGRSRELACGGVLNVRRPRMRRPKPGSLLPSSPAG